MKFKVGDYVELKGEKRKWMIRNASSPCSNYWILGGVIAEFLDKEELERDKSRGIIEEDQGYIGVQFFPAHFWWVDDSDIELLENPNPFILPQFKEYRKRIGVEE